MYYRVRPGDSLWSIAQRVYGNGQYWRMLYYANDEVYNPNLIYAGEVLYLPS